MLQLSTKAAAGESPASILGALMIPPDDATGSELSFRSRDRLRTSPADHAPPLSLSFPPDGTGMPPVCGPRLQADSTCSPGATERDTDQRMRRFLDQVAERLTLSSDPATFLSSPATRPLHTARPWRSIIPATTGLAGRRVCGDVTPLAARVMIDVLFERQAHATRSLSARERTWLLRRSSHLSLAAKTIAEHSGRSVPATASVLAFLLSYGAAVVAAAIPRVLAEATGPVGLSGAVREAIGYSPGAVAALIADASEAPPQWPRILVGLFGDFPIVLGPRSERICQVLRSAEALTAQTESFANDADTILALGWN